MKRLLTVVSLILVVFPLFGSENSLITGPNQSYTISAPPGWVLDTKSMLKQNIKALFYKEGIKFSPAGLHIYINSLAIPETEELDHFIFNDILGFKRIYKNARYEYDYTYVTAHKHEIMIYRMDDTAVKYWQYIGYLKIRGTINIFVLSARSPEERAENKAAFERLLDSFSLAEGRK